jgi:hypothetical protein
MIGRPRIKRIREELERLEALFWEARATQTSSRALRAQLATLMLLRNKVDPDTHMWIERLWALLAKPTQAPPPTITSIVIGGPAALGDIDGNIPFLLTGTSFVNVLSVTIGGLPATGVGIDTATSTQLSGFTPALPVGTGYDVVITTLSGSFTLPGAFESWDADQIIAPAVAHVYDSEEGIITTGGFADSWADQGAGANTLTGAGAVRPAYQAARFGDNLRHGLNYDAVDDVLTLAAAIPLTDRTIFAAFKWNVAGATASELVTGTSGSIYDFALDGSAGLVTMRLFDANIPANRRSPDDPELCSGAPVGTALGGGSAKIIGQTYDGTLGEIRFYLNNTQQGAPVATTAVAVNWKSVGAGVGNTGEGLQGAFVIAEAILTASDRAKTVAWMWGKWLARSTAFERLSDNTAWFARDGAALLALGDDIYLLGGWNSQGGGQFPAGKKVTNEIWKSIDKGATYTLIKANDYTPVPADSFWTPRHTAGAVVHRDGGADYLYIIGSDVYNGPQNNLGNGLGTSDVWRSPDGVNWTRITDAAPWGPRVLHMVASYNGALYVMGGMTDSTDATTCLNDVWRSDDGGLTWTQLANAPWAPRGTVNSGQGLPVYQNKIWLMGGGTYVNIPAGALFNDVWNFDGTTWTQVLADGVAPWVQRQYNATFVNKSNRLCVVNGVSDFIGTNISDCWESDDGVIWFQELFTPWRPSHADGVVAISDRVVIGPGNGQIGSPIDPGTGTAFAIVRLGFAHP